MNPRFLALILAATLAPAQTSLPARHTFAVSGDHFTLDGRPFKVLSGELHYARIPREYWHARLRLARAMGLNTVATYVFWNVHEPTPGHYDFTGNNDLHAFLQAAQQEGLYVILRAGPYACAEWDLGGLPAWLLDGPAKAQPFPPQRTEGAKTASRSTLDQPYLAPLRSTNPAFLAPADRWIHRLGQEVADLQIGNGGPILMTQVENEYGNFGPGAGDEAKAYMAHLRQTFLDSGFTASLLYSADNWRNIPRGDLPGLLAATNFGIGNPTGGMDALARERPGAPLFISEYWPGWFDHWGHPHETRPTPLQLKDVDAILRRAAGINLYMFHGGTSFGFMAGSSFIDHHFLPDVTSYDYDAPLDEAGHPTPKFAAYRDLLARYACPQAVDAKLSIPATLPAEAQQSKEPHLQPASFTSQLSQPETCLPPVPPTPPIITIPTLTLVRQTPLWSRLPAAIPSELPEPMEHFGQSFGYILYRRHLDTPIAGPLTLTGLHDFAAIYLDGTLIGTLDRRDTQWDSANRSELPLSLSLHTTHPALLDILVANDGRINSTGMMRSEAKGLTGPVTLAGTSLVGNWQTFPLPMSSAPASSPSQKSLPTHAIPESRAGRLHSPVSLAGRTPTGQPVFEQATFTLTSIGDTFLDISHLGKGALWVNGHPIGRFWNTGPQQTLYVPGPWLHVGANRIVVFDMLPPPTASRLTGLDHPVLDAPVPDLAKGSQE